MGQREDGFLGAGNNSLQKVAIICGAIKGIGLSIALEIGKKDITCVLPVYDWLESLDATYQKLRENNVKYDIIPADLRKKSDVARLVNHCQEKYGRIDYLVNNIERGGWPVVHGEYSDEQWDLEFQTTITAKYNLLESIVPIIKKLGNAGAVVNISSISAITGRNGIAGMIFNDCYSLANRAVQSITEQFARIGAPNVRVNELMLGIIETRHGPKTRGWSQLSKSQKADLLNHILLKRTGFCEEVARMVAFLIFDATYTTGSIIKMDGGFTLGGEGVPDIPKGIVEGEEKKYGGKSIEETDIK